MIVEKIVNTTVFDKLEIIGATLLSVEEAEKLPLSLRRYSNWWWLRSPGGNQRRVANVSHDGGSHCYGSSVNIYTYAVRPALIIANIASSNFHVGEQFMFGDKIFEIIAENLAFCISDIGAYCFRDDYKANDANDYEKSDIKKYIEGWFSKAKNEYGRNTICDAAIC